MPFKVVFKWEGLSLIVTHISSDKEFEIGETIFADNSFFPFSGGVYLVSYESHTMADKVQKGKYLYACKPIGKMTRDGTYDNILSDGLEILRKFS